mgnify:FL=1
MLGVREASVEERANNKKDDVDEKITLDLKESWDMHFKKID